MALPMSRIRASAARTELFGPSTKETWTAIQRWSSSSWVSGKSPGYPSDARAADLVVDEDDPDDWIWALDPDSPDAVPVVTSTEWNPLGNAVDDNEDEAR